MVTCGAAVRATTGEEKGRYQFGECNKHGLSVKTILDDFLNFQEMLFIPGLLVGVVINSYTVN
jgi:hypothetical protein